MTTNNITTPWDAEIAEHKGLRDTWLYVGNLQSKAEGYRRAKDEDASLLQALKVLLKQCPSCAPFEFWAASGCVKPGHLTARKAIAQATPKE